MLSEKNLEELQCAVSNQQHFLINPITLNKCGHSICKRCIPKKEITLVKCKICDIASFQDFKNTEISTTSQQAIKTCINGLFDILEKETAMKLNDLKDSKKEKQEFLESKFQFIEDEISVRVESVKIEVEEMGEKLKEKLGEMKKEIFTLDKDDEAKIENLKEALNELQNNLKNNINLNERYLNYYQNKMVELNGLIKKNENYEIPEISKTIEQDSIAQLYHFNNRELDVIDLLKNGKREIIDLEKFGPLELLVLPNSNIIIVYIDEFTFMNFKCIALFDQNLKLIKKVNEINEQQFDTTGISLNQKEMKIYISDCKNHQIIMTDFELKFIKSVGSEGKGDYQFNFPGGIYFLNNNLYVCDSFNERIQIFNQNFEFVNSVRLLLSPLKILASDSMFCVISHSTHIYLFSIKDFKHHKTLDYYGGTVSEVNSWFYKFNYYTKKFYCFDNEGELEENFTLTGIDDSLFKNKSDGVLVKFNGTLLMTSYSSNMIIKFSANSA